MDFGLGFSCELRIKKKKKMLRRGRFKFWEGRNCVCRADDKEMERVEGWSECWHSLSCVKEFSPVPIQFTVSCVVILLRFRARAIENLPTKGTNLSCS